jgi:hypothetical protein
LFNSWLQRSRLTSFVFAFADLVVLSTLEFSRLGESLLPIVRSQPSSGASAISTSGVAKALLSSRQHSDLFLRLSAYCGGFNSNTPKHRYDTAGALEQVRPVNMVYYLYWLYKACVTS